MSILKSEEYKPSGLPCPNSSASFWHSEPNVALLGHRTTPNLPSAVDVVIVGSGITGASIARYFAEDDRASNLSIIMLEAREACWGATGRNGGHCQPLLTERPPNVGQFEVKNLEAVQSYIEKHNVECEFRLGSACRAFFSKELYEEGLKELQMLERRAPELRKLVRLVTDKDELAKHRISPKAYGATITQGAAQLWPYKFCAAIMQRLVGEGKLNLQTNTPVLSLESQSKTSDAAAVPYVLVRTPRGTIKAKHVILATNGYTSHLLPEFSSLIVPTRCEMSALQPPANSERLPNSYGFVGKTVADDDYLIQRPFYTDAAGQRRGGQLMFGGGSTHIQYPRMGMSDDDIVDQGEAAYLRKQLLEYMQLGGDDAEAKEQGELRASHQWTGIKGTSRDNMPWVGRVPEQPGVWLCGGYTGHGMPNATLCGRAVSLMVLAQLSATTSSSHAAEAALNEVTASMVAAGDLPEQYVLTPERIERTMMMPTVAMREEEALRPLAGDLLTETGSDGFVTDEDDASPLADVQAQKCAVM